MLSRLVPLYMVSSLLVVACSDPQPAPAPSPDATTAGNAASNNAAASTSSAPAATANPIATQAAAAPASAAPTAGEAAEEAVASDEMPPVALFGAAKDLRVTGSSELACEVKEVQGWVRVICQGKTRKGESLREIAVLEGQVAGKTKIKVDAGLQGQLITPLPAGKILRARFKWLDREHTLTIDRAGSANPNPFGEFSDFEARPSSDDFNAGSEVGVRGSTALGCSTRFASGWFRIHCGTNNRVGGAPQSLEVLDGGKPSTSTTVVPGSVLELTTPFESGDSLSARFVWAEAAHTLNIEWPAGHAQPSSFGAFEGFNSLPDAAEFDKATEVVVKGSSALKCSTKYIPGWFRAVCIGNNDTGGTPNEVKVLQGVDAKDMATHAAKGIMSLTAKVNAGTTLRADFAWSDKTMRLFIDWPEKKPQPKTFGEFKAADAASD